MQGRDHDARRLSILWLAQFVSGMSTRKLQDHIADAVLFERKRDPARIRYAASLNESGRKRGRVLKDASDLRSLDGFNGACPGAFDETGKILLIKREPAIA